MRLRRDPSGVSPVIGVIIAVAITVILASIAYVWFATFTEDVGETVVEPMRVTPELNIERIHDELALEIVIGRSINWDDYTVMLNYKVVNTRTGTISSEGDMVYFDYQGPPLAEGNWYPFDIIDKLRNTVVFSDEVYAQSYTPEGTGVYGYVRSAEDGTPVPGAIVKLNSRGEVLNITQTDPTGAYYISYTGGVYTLSVEVDSTFPETFGEEYEPYSNEVAIGVYFLTRLDVVLTPLLPETALVKGFVYDQKTGDPLPGADVRATDNKLFSKVNTTDADGYFEMTLPAANISFFCEKDGYKKFRIGFSVDADETKTLEVHMELMPVETARVFGRVYEQKNGDPLAGVNVFAETGYGSNFSKTDDGGYYEIRVAPGNTTLFVNTAGYELWTDSVVIADKQSYQVDIYLVAEKS